MLEATACSSRSRRVGAYLFERLRGLQARHGDRIVEVRGAGLIAGLELTADAAPVVNAALERGLLVNRTSTTVVRLLPPYIVTEREVDEAVEILDAVSVTYVGRTFRSAARRRQGTKCPDSSCDRQPRLMRPRCTR